MYGNPQDPQHGQAKEPMSTGKKIGISCAGCAGLTIMLALVLGACGAVIGAGEDTAGGPAPAETSAASTEKPEEPAKEEKSKPAKETEPESGGTISDGVHLVGDDIDPGTWRTDGPGPDSLAGMCYWARLSDTSGELDGIIANQNIQGSGVVSVSDSDVALELSGGCEWELTG